MEWWLILVVIFLGLMALMATGLPVAFCFLLVNLIVGVCVWGTGPGPEQVILGMPASVVNFFLLPLPLFILMGDVMFQCGIAPYMIDAVDKWLGRLPGRLGILAVAAGVLFSTLTGTSMASIAMLGESLAPQMEMRGYKKIMSLGPIMGAGGLAIMIPPSNLAVILGVVGEISIGGILIGIIMPGLLLAVIYIAYIVIRCYLQPELAPVYEVPPIPLSEKLESTVKYILPVAFVIFMVVGIVFVGLATPTEAAASGALATIILAAAYKKLNWQTMKKSLKSTVKTSVMVLIILTGAQVFSQILSFSGAATGLAEFAAGLNVPPITILIAMQIALLILGMIMDAASIMLITLPIFMPIVNNLGFDPIWFAVIFMVNMEVAGISPPFGLGLFVMKAVAPKDTTMGDVIWAATPFMIMQIGAMALVMAFPQIALWLPKLMH
jgi:tripartite ATP-independent transporter DctM subunit